jgi:hypothetical protein
MARARIALVALVACAVLRTPAAAASFVLTPKEQEEAVRMGERSVVNETFGSEWSSANEGGDDVTVMTPFLRLALAARQAAFKERPMTPVDVDKVLREDRDRLIFWVTLRGPRGDFARFYSPGLIAGGAAELRPSFVQNERSALRQRDGRYLARCVYGFATETLSPKGRVVLIVRDQNGKEVTRFAVDLAGVR